jgi:hypothetical protein
MVGVVVTPAEIANQCSIVLGVALTPARGGSKIDRAGVAITSADGVFV